MAEKLEIILTLKDQASKSLAKFDAAMRRIDKTTPKTASAMERVGSAINGVAKALTAGAVVAGTFIKALDMAEAGASLQRLEASGNSLASSMDQDMSAILESMRRASSGVLSNAQMMFAANRALRLGVAQTPAEFDKLTRAAIALGRAMGRDAGESIDDIVVGIGRMSPLILDNLGIMVKGGAIWDDFAAQTGRTAAELSEAEKKMVLLNQTLIDAAPILDETGQLMQDNAAIIEEFHARIADMRGEVEIWLANGLTPWMEIMSDLPFALNAADMGMVAWLNSLASGKPFLEELHALASQFNADLFELPRAFDASGAIEIPDLSGVAEAVVAVMPEIPSIWDKVFPDPATLAGKIADQIEFIQSGGPQILQAIQEVQDAMAAGAISPEEALPMLDDLQEAALAIPVAAGDMTAWDAARTNAADFGGTIGQARLDIEAASDAIALIPTAITIHIQTIIDQTPGFAHGGSFIVGGPGATDRGGPDDRMVAFPARTGERVDVTPQDGGGGGGGNTINLNINGGDPKQIERVIRRYFQGSG